MEIFTYSQDELISQDTLLNGLGMICKQTSVLLSAEEKLTSVVDNERVIITSLSGQWMSFSSLSTKAEVEYQ